MLRDKKIEALSICVTQAKDKTRYLSIVNIAPKDSIITAVKG